MASYNRIVLMGNLTRDPQLSYTPANTAICKFGIATNRTCPHGEAHRLTISGTRLREMFANHEPIPAEFSRPEVLAVLQEHYDGLTQ